MKVILFIFSILVSTGSCSSQDTHLDKNDKHMNKLKYSSSPYLQQHANNPVHWQEWGEEALQMAKDEDKPLIISIGYAACHWCHVMERESFSNEEVAAFMNENFVCVKVDREERPDIDRIYMDAAQLINGQGGWPLNAFALPDGKPFFAGTYFNKNQWMDVLTKISNMYKTDKGKLIDYANKLSKAIQKSSLSNTFAPTHAKFESKDYNNLYFQWKSQIDFKKGGFNRVPKFPIPVAWEFILQYNYLTKDNNALDATVTALDAMAKGGIYDQIGGGFARYSTDADWKVPHFEKMLYDNAQLVTLYANAYKITKSERYKEIIIQTLKFVQRELTNTDGAFYSSLNADSEGVEGKYYVWTADQFNQIVNDDSAKLVSDYYQISKAGNWEHGNNILLPKNTKLTYAQQHGISLKQLNLFLKKADAKLLNFREMRERPSTDNKILTSWNALMITAYVDAATALGDDNYLQAALKCATFIESNMLRNDGAMLRNYMNGKASIAAFHDDYALFAQACADIYSVTFDKHWLIISKKLTDYCIEHFRDKKTGMFYYTSDVSESLIARKFELTDNVIPSSNSVMANVLLRLGHYYDDEKYIAMSKQMLNNVIKNVKKAGPYYANWAILLGTLSYEPFEVAIMGDDAIKMNTTIQLHYLPTSFFLGGTSENLPLLEGRLVEDQTLIYICRNKTCGLPVKTVVDALKQIN